MAKNIKLIAILRYSILKNVIGLSFSGPSKKRFLTLKNRVKHR